MIPQDSSIEKDDVRHYLQMLQDIINRMAANSSNCKAWAITLFTAMAALMIGVEAMRQWVWIILFPIALFYFLDAYYLGLENDFRDLEASFIKRLRGQCDCSSAVYDFNFTNADGYKKGKNLMKGLKSTATWPLYSTLAAISLVLWLFFVNTPKANNKVQELEEPLRQLVVKQDSIAHALNTFIEKYKPVSVESKSYHNSSFFRANNVDSVAVKVYGNK